jgi:hypothetical protein
MVLLFSVDTTATRTLFWVALAIVWIATSLLLPGVLAEARRSSRRTARSVGSAATRIEMADRCE